ncbi:lytic transglycosylase domain-containing protein [Agromyces allii]|uniref:Lytic murein transglycosylase n=1 Tax=Agromyces allii TaxID=393607 RepID=A0ABP5C9T9_9MICO|nr:lytic murein transglycosylase [Agromyces allii]
MSWDDDFDADAEERGGHRRVRERATAWQIVRRSAAYAGVVVGAVALVVGAVVAVNVVGTATNPGGFAAPAADGPHVALPPSTTQAGESADPQPSDTGEALAEGDASTPDEPSGLSGAVQMPAPAPMPLVDAEWSEQIASSTGIPERALAAYALAHIVLAAQDPECGVDWATVAAIGSIESGHGSHGGAALDDAGLAQPAIIGRALDGNGVAKIPDTDGGTLDGDLTWDRAVGPMQFIPSTWVQWGADGNGDGLIDPNQIDDAALTTATYLCASGSMTTPEGWRAAIYSYNHDNDYVDKVAKVAQGYAAAVG